jgi:hypothetical protein
LTNKMAERYEEYVPPDYAEALSQVIAQRLHGGPSGHDRDDLRTLQVKLSRAANNRQGAVLSLNYGEKS